MNNLCKRVSALLCAFTMCALAGCGGVSAPPVTASPGAPTTSGATSAPVYVIQGTSTNTDQILTFATGSTGSASPSATLTTNLYLIGVAVDTSGQIYAAGVNATTLANIVNVYAAGATGTATPVRTITLAAQPVAIAVDSAGSLYVADTSAEVVVYGSTATGTAAPTRTISGALTAIGTPESVAVDSSGGVYLSSFSQSTGLGSILVFGASVSGNVAPSSIITAPSGSAFLGVAVDSAKNIYASTDSTGASTFSTVLEYSAGSSGAATPVKTITGSSTGISNGLSDVGELALDSAGNIYLPVETAVSANSSSYAVLEFAAGANGNVAPAAKFSSTSLTAEGASIAVH